MVRACVYVGDECECGCAVDRGCGYICICICVDGPSIHKPAKRGVWIRIHNMDHHRCLMAPPPQTHHTATIGLMVTASHNPVQDNGVKMVDPHGGCVPGPEPERGWRYVSVDVFVWVCSQPVAPSHARTPTIIHTIHRPHPKTPTPPPNIRSFPRIRTPTSTHKPSTPKQDAGHGVGGARRAARQCRGRRGAGGRGGRHLRGGGRGPGGLGANACSVSLSLELCVVWVYINEVSVELCACIDM